MEALKGVRKVKVEGIPYTVKRVIYTDGEKFFINHYNKMIEVVYFENKWYTV